MSCVRMRTLPSWHVGPTAPTLGGVYARSAPTAAVTHDAVTNSVSSLMRTTYSAPSSKALRVISLKGTRPGCAG